MAIMKPVFRNGIILLLDALGAKHFSEDDAIKFIIMRDKIVSDLQSQISKYIEPIATLEVMYTGKRPDPPQILTFGDTIAIAWQPSNFVKSHELFSIHPIFWAIEFISKGMAVSILFRGALSFGKYLLIENTLLGPAVADAAYWYEQPQMIGVVATPSTSHNYKWLLEQDKKNNFMPFIIEYDVPIKNNNSIRTYAINWPAGYMVPFMDGRIKTHYKEEFYKDLKQITVPPGTENKYKNTIDFFSHCEKKTLEIIKKYYHKDENQIH